MDIAITKSPTAGTRSKPADADLGLRPDPHGPHVPDGLLHGTRLAQPADRAVPRPDPRPGGDRPALQPAGLRGPEGVPPAGRRHRAVSTGQECRADERLDRADGHALVRRRGVPGRSEGACGARPLLASHLRGHRDLHQADDDRHGGGIRRPAVGDLPVLHRAQPRRALLQGRVQPNAHLRLRRVHPRRGAASATPRPRATTARPCTCPRRPRRGATRRSCGSTPWSESTSRRSARATSSS